MRSGEYFEQNNIDGVNFDSGILFNCFQEPQTKFYTSNLNFCVKMAIGGPSTKRCPLQG